MTKSKFIQKLRKALKGLPKNEREEILRDYEEHFAFALAEGKTEEEIAKSLGSPTQIAKEILADYHVDQVDTKMTAGNILRAAWAVIGLSFFNLVIVLGPAVAAAGIIFAGWVIGAAFFITPLLAIFDAIVHPSKLMFFNFFMTLILCGLGYFIMLGMAFITKAAVNGFIRYLKFNVSLVKGGLKKDE